MPIDFFCHHFSLNASTLCGWWRAAAGRGQGVMWLLDGPGGGGSDRLKVRGRSYFIPWLEIGRLSRAARTREGERQIGGDARSNFVRITRIDGSWKIWFARESGFSQGAQFISTSRLVLKFARHANFQANCSGGLRHLLTSGLCRILQVNESTFRLVSFTPSFRRTPFIALRRVIR